MDLGLARIDVEIPAFNEWRVETPKNSTFTLKLESGTAEIFGSELSPDLTYVFKEEMKFAVATYHAWVQDFIHLYRSSGFRIHI